MLAWSDINDRLLVISFSPFTRPSVTTNNEPSTFSSFTSLRSAWLPFAT